MSSEGGRGAVGVHVERVTRPGCPGTLKWRVRTGLHGLDGAEELVGARGGHEVAGEDRWGFAFLGQGSGVAVGRGAQLGV